MDYIIVTLPKKTFVGVGVNTTNENDRSVVDIADQWGCFTPQEFMKELIIS